jgi:hypothetical protein
MEEISIQYHLMLPAIISLVGLLVILFYRKKLFVKNRLFWICITIFLIVYLYFVGTATYESIYFQWDLNKFDLNQDGMFSGDEITTEQKKAMNNLISDTGRNFSFITGFIFSLFISTIVYIIGLIKLKFDVNRTNTKMIN